jgi:hypothetical protein
MNKKGQAAMEFLMTYGWAILVVLIAIGALAYFGVLNPGKYLPSSCTISNQIGCSEFKVQAVTGHLTDHNVILVLQNGRGVDLNTVSVALSAINPGTVTGCTQVAANTTDGLATISDGASVRYFFDCAGVMPTSASKFKATISVTYADVGSSLGARTATGSLTTKVE